VADQEARPSALPKPAQAEDSSTAELVARSPAPSKPAQAVPAAMAPVPEQEPPTAAPAAGAVEVRAEAAQPTTTAVPMTTAPKPRATVAMARPSDRRAVHPRLGP
jgi:hypothetical protein